MEASNCATELIQYHCLKSSACCQEKVSAAARRAARVDPMVALRGE
jgi:hypothetical protein